jgi:hypothetical protein
MARVTPTAQYHRKFCGKENENLLTPFAILQPEVAVRMIPPITPMKTTAKTHSVVAALSDCRRFSGKLTHIRRSQRAASSQNALVLFGLPPPARHGIVNLYLTPMPD